MLTESFYAVNEYAKLAAIKLNGTPGILWESEDDLAEVSSPVATKDFFDCGYELRNYLLL